MTVVSSADLTKQKQEVELDFSTDLPPPRAKSVCHLPELIARRPLAGPSDRVRE